MQSQKPRAMSQTDQEQHDGVGAHEDREAAAPEWQAPSAETTTHL